MLVISAHYVTFFGDSLQLGKWSRIIFTLDGSGAEIGVNFFFVLSGFLITYLILTDAGQTDFSYIKKFYLRRVLRIWPLYFLTVAIGFFLFPIIVKIPHYVEAASGWMYLFFLANLDQIYFWKDAVHPNALLGVHWSVAVEEQFYLLWPWLFVFFRKQFVWVGALIWLTAFCFQWYSGLHSHTISSFQDLAIGGLLAYACVAYKEQLIKQLKKLNSWWQLTIYGIGFVVLIAQYQVSKNVPIYQVLYRPVNALFFCWVIFDQCFNANQLLAVTKIPVVSYLGKISYGLYLLHPVALLLLKTYWFESLNVFWVLPIALALSVALASASYHLYESFFLKLKTRYA